MPVIRTLSVYLISTPVPRKAYLINIYMRIWEITERSYNNWVNYTPDSLQADYSEYKHKETTKWQRRAEQIGARWPLFDSLEHFQQALDQSPVVEIDKLHDVQNLTRNASISGIKDMVSSYAMPRDVDRIVQGLQENKPLPLPIILKGSKGMWIMAGNTRQATSRVLGIIPRALLVDVSLDQ